jgi:hypothetical protein
MKTRAVPESILNSSQRSERAHDHFCGPSAFAGRQTSSGGTPPARRGPFAFRLIQLQ